MHCDLWVETLCRLLPFQRSVWPPSSGQNEDGGNTFP
jgi:hypothetical protein